MVKLQGFMRGLALFFFTAGFLAAQPSITGAITAGYGSPTSATAITAGTPEKKGSQLLLFIPVASPEGLQATWTPNGGESTTLMSIPGDGVLIANVPMSLYATAPPGAPNNVQITVFYPDCGLYADAVRPREGDFCTSSPSPFTVNPALAAVGTLPNGAVGTAYSQPFFTGGTPPYTFTASPPGLSTSPTSNILSGTPTLAGTFNAPTITDFWGNSLNPGESITIGGLTITATGLPGGVAGQPYSATVSAMGGTPPYMWSATLPPSLGINAATGFISGVPAQSGSYQATIRVVDSGSPQQSAQVTFPLSIASPPPPPLQITTPSLSNGTVGQVYAAQLAAFGGSGSYTFTVANGSLPPGVNLFINGEIFGTPSAPGTYTFTAQVNDGQTTATRAYTVIIAPASLTITGAPPATVQANSPVSVQFGASGGVSPYTLMLSGTPPTGTSFAGNTLSGTATTPGVFNFTITATDSESPAVSISKSFSITVTALPITITANLPAGQVGQAYSGQLSATGGTGGFTWSGTAGDGLSVSSTGAVTGTPTTAGTVSLSATVADSSGTKASGNFSITIAPSSLSITPTTLPAGQLTLGYSAGLNATGGTMPYTWSASGLPGGLSISSTTGVITGTPTATGTFTVAATVTDATGATANAALKLTVNPAPINATPPSNSSASLGQPFSAGFSATGGTMPYTWSATGLPGGLTIAPSTGAVTGTPSALGTFSIMATVTDATGQTATATLSLTVALPASPTVNLSGLPSNGAPGSQATTSITLSSSYPVDVTVTLTLTFTPVNGADDPNIQFASGGRTTTVTVPAGSTVSATNVGVQTGTVAGTITITASLSTPNGTNITPTPAPTFTIVIPAAAPTISSVSVATSSTGFTVTVIGFDPTRSITQATFTFTPAAGSTLQTTTATVPVQSLFTAWYQSSTSAQFGSQFSFTMPFTVGGNVSGIASVSVTLTNATGTSSAVSATI